MLNRLTDQTRSIAAAVLIVLGGVLLFAGTIAFYAREEIINREQFADRAVEALDDDGVRLVVGREIVVNAIERGSTDLVAARPLLESVIEAVLQTEPFRRIFRAAALETNRIFFVREKSNVLFDLGDAAEVVQFALRSVSPKVARQLPEDLKPQLLTLRRRKFAGATLSAADAVRPLGVVLPLLALLTFAGAIAVSPDRRVAVLRTGIAVGATGAVLAAVLLILRARVLAGVVGEDEVTDEEVQDAVAGVLDAYLGDLLGWALVLGLFGLVIGAAAAALDPEDVEDPVRRMRERLVRRPRTTAGRVARGLAALAAGVLAVLNPTLAVHVLAIGAGAILVFFGASELLAMLQRPGQTGAEAQRLRGRALAGAGLAGVLVVGAFVALVLVITSGGPDPRAADVVAYDGRCNGSSGLCDVRLNEAVFAGTHNSFSAADSPGWFIANQKRTIQRQLDDGIRLFLIDPHWGIQDENGKVRTDFRSEGRSRNRVAMAMPPEVLKSAERLAGRLGAGNIEGERDVWLCHTVCELGATRMVDSLEVIRKFLDGHRGEVVILFIEPYVQPAEIAKVFERAGLDRYVVTLARDEPLPTLGQLVHRNRRVVVFTEKDADGTVPWYLDGFSFVQDTPLGATKVKQLSCRRERGDADSPIAMINHWADLFPPRRSANKPFQRRSVIVGRAHRCAEKLGVTVNLIAVDHYDQGDLFGAVEELNAERIETVRREQRAFRGG
jgi:hypothetical protein